MNRLRTAGAILLLTALSFFVFPGHTYLQQDSQIYVPILENQRNPAVLANDMLVQKPHVGFTFYDELTNGVRWVTRAPVKYVLEGEQFVFRALGFAGIYLIGLALDLPAVPALVVTAIWSLGAAIPGPEVLLLEYEPTPRSFAVPLLFLAAGLALRGRYIWAGAAGALAFTMHAPTTWPFWLVYLGVIAVRRRAAWGLLPLALAAAALAATGTIGHVAQQQHLFEHVQPQQEVLLRMRTAYDFVSTWWKQWIGDYLLFALVAAVALIRLAPRREASIFFGGLILAGLGSVPLSWWLLEHQGLMMGPEIQPARALLFVSGSAIVLCSIVGSRAALAKRRLEAAAWFFFALLIAVGSHDWRPVLVMAAFSVVLAVGRQTFQIPVAVLLAPAMLFAAGIVPHRNIDTADLARLADWARRETPQSAVFLFPEAGRGREPGWFRATALRAVYVDWKGGGQVNYLRDLGYEWWERWNGAMTGKLAPADYESMGIQFLVLPHPLEAGLEPCYQNQSWQAYRIGN